MTTSRMLLLSLAILPMLLASGFIAFQARNDLEDQGLTLQQQDTRLAANTLSDFVSDRVAQLQVMSEVQHLTSATPEAQAATLASLLRYDSAYQEFALLDVQGQETIHISRDQNVAADDLTSRNDQPEFTQPLATQAIYFSPARFSDLIQEPLMSVAIPLEDIRTGEVSLILVAEIRFRPLWDVITEMQGDGDTIYMVTSAGEVVAHTDPSLILRKTTFTLPAEDGQTTGLAGSEVILTHTPLSFGDQTLTVALERPSTNTFSRATDTLPRAALILAVATIISLIAIIGIGQLTKSAL